ncbi:MAG: hypothetical protein WC334_00545 [Kiritimatiellales bacterium]|jgi:hypothetical protein
MKIHRLYLLTFQIVAVFAIAPLSHAVHHPYTLDQPTAGSYLNEVWERYGMSEGPANANGNEKVILGSSGWHEWNALKVAWTDHQLTTYTNSMNYIKNVWVTGLPGCPATTSTATGFVWSANIAANDGRWMGGPAFLQWHYDQMPRYICAVYHTYMWGRDYAFLTNVMPKARAVMSYMTNTMQGSTAGLLICPGANNGRSGTPGQIGGNGTLTGGGTPSTYMDNFRSGYKDAWINAVYYTALLNMADLEDVTGNTAKGTEYRNMAATVSQNFSAELWQGSRFVGWKDIDGQLHGGNTDGVGYTYVNTEALARGLGSPWRAHRVYNWMDSETAQPTVKGAYIGSTDIYQAVIAPRTVTARMPDKDFCEWTMTGRYAAGTNYVYGYGNHMQDGGTIMFYNYYDVMARLRWLDADNAYTKLADMLRRCAYEGNYMSNGTNLSRLYNSYGDYFLAVGTSSAYPESGISGLSMLYGFMGVEAKKNGLNINPKLPSRLFSAQCADTYYQRTNRTVKVARGTIVQQLNSHTAPQTLVTANDVLSQDFIATGAFNELGVYMGNYVTSGSRSCDASLYTYANGIYTKVATRQLVVTDDNAWANFTFPLQSANQQYRVELSNVAGGQLAWWWHGTSSYWTANCVAQKNGVDIGGGYRLRIMNAPLTTVIAAPTPNWNDVCPATNGFLMMSFNSTSWFTRVSVNVDIPAGESAGCSLMLERVMGTGNIRTVAVQEFNEVEGNSWLTLTLADQPAGDYILTMSEPAGIMRWRRNATETNSRIGDTTRVLDDGTTTVFSGDQVIKVERGRYIISVTPGQSAPVTNNVGTAYIFNP